MIMPSKFIPTWRSCNKKVTEFQALLTDEATRPQAMEIIRLMIVRIEVSAGQERGKPDVVLVGALAQILTFTQQNKTAAFNGSGGRVLVGCGGSIPTITYSGFLFYPHRSA